MPSPMCYTLLEMKSNHGMILRTKLCTGPMSQFDIDEIVALVDSVARMSGLPVTWKLFEPEESRRVPRRVSTHTNPFCRELKLQRLSLDRCMRDDVYRFTAQSDHPRESCLRTCHAGVVELLVPIVRSGRCTGVFFVGPVRQARDVCAYGSMRSHFMALPILDRQRLDDAREVLTFAARRLGDVGAGGIRWSVPKLDTRIAAVLEHIDKHLDDKLVVANLAKLVYLSPSRLMHLFSTQLGQPLSVYVTGRRMEHAQRLLEQSDLSITAVAHACGYPNPDYFSAAFRSAVGCSPTVYRRNAGATTES